ncbi:phage tail tube protein [Streptomyces sp. DSM 41014]|uniref:Phage tail tube protein n=1 Tax=Streptomyces hintoniae TaxID=3075521 RepID=A0ABU2UHZ8_9ACTN|nr:phage tail tube protein [Streptomyces sp. DSM 41014]MDT0472783.1 phage tail tube protein [Streptomyces sp. DSM 41014]
MATIFDQYFGVGDETTYGTAVAPTKFYAFQSEGIEGKYERIESEAIRAGTRVLRADRFVTNAKGAEGDVKLEVLSGGFDFWLKHMMGSLVSGTATGGFVTHTATLGDLNGKSFTAQVGRVDNTGSLIPFTYEGGKVKEWEIANAVDELLTISATMDFAKETIGAGAGAYAAATPAFTANTKLFSFNSGAVTVGGASFDISDFSLKGTSGLKDDRYFIRSGGKKSEPLENELRKYEWAIKGEFQGTTHVNRVAAALASGALADITVLWDGPDGSQFKVQMPFARFDEGPVTAGGVEVLAHDMSGVALTDGATSPVTLTYKAITAA